MAETNPPQNPEQEENKPSTLESVVDEVWNAGKSALKIGVAAALPFSWSFIDPGHLRNAVVFSHTITAGRATANLMQNKPALEGVIAESARGTGLSYLISNVFTGLNNLETAMQPQYGTVATKAAKIGGAIFGLQPTITTLYTASKYGLGKKFRENVWPSIKTTFKYLALPAAINVGFLYQYGLLTQMFVSGLVSYGFGLVQALRTGEGSFKNLFEAINPFSYASAALSVTSKAAKSVFYGVPNAFYSLGSSIRDLYKKAPKPTPKIPEPELNPA